jgi:hypothetical protein
MPIVPIENVGQLGIIKDTPPYSIPPNAWSDGNNVRFLDNGVKKIAGYREVMATCPFGPYYIVPYLSSAGQYYWIAFGEKDIAAWTGTTWIDITRQATLQLNGAVSASAATITVDTGATLTALSASGTLHVGTDITGDVSTNKYEELTYSARDTSTGVITLTGTTLYAHANNAVVTPSGATATTDNDYGANTGSRRWMVTNLNGLLVATNGFDAPQMWPLSSGIPSTSNPFMQLRNWPNPSHTCKSIRAFRTFLIGLNWSKDNQEPRLVKWSTEASSGDPPSTWDAGDNTLDAGEFELADTAGDIVDGLPLGDSFLIYKEDAIYIMNYVGTPYIFSFKLLSPTVGALSKDAIAEYDGGHFFIGNSDCYVCNGQAVTPLLPNKVRRAMFEDLSGENYLKCFVAADYVRNEMLACFPKSGSSIVDKALIWNWKDNTFSFRDLPDTSFINHGIIDITAGAKWDLNTNIWNEGIGNWGERNYDNVKKNLVFAKAGEGTAITAATQANPVVITSASHGLTDADFVVINNVVGMVELNGNSYYADVLTADTFSLYSNAALTSAINGTGYAAYSSGGDIYEPKVFRDSFGNQKDTTNMTSFIERSGYDLGDPSSVKFVRAVYPKMEVSGNNSVNIYIGRQMSTEEGITWEGPIAFNPNTQSKVSCRVSGKYFGFKVESTTDVDWKLHGVAFDVQPSGARGSRMQ